MYIFNMIN